MNNTALLTGGAGYIGGHAALALHDAGWNIVVLDDLSSGSRRALLPGAVFYEGETGDEALLNSVFAKHDIAAVLHLAAVASVPESVANPERCFRINLQDTITLMETAKKHGVLRFIFSSTSAVYDENAAPPFAEDAPLRPISPYAESKLAAEKEFAARGMRCAVLRYFNVGGADKNGRAGNYKKHDTTLIKSAAECAAGKRPHLNIYGTDYPTPDGTCIRDYIHVSDVAAAHVLALEYLMNGGAPDVFNLGLGRGFSVKEIVAAAKQVTGVDFLTKETARREGDPAAVFADAAKARRVLGFAPKTQTPEEIIADAWAREIKTET